tara:strand:- start:131 stop:595 length:465 start_codon:yes stop_codon:yes gene_type:complete
MLALAAMSPSFVAPAMTSKVMRSRMVVMDGKGFGGGEATRDPAPTAIDPNDPKGKQQAIFKAESFADYLARRNGGGGDAPAAAAPPAAPPAAAPPAAPGSPEDEGKAVGYDPQLSYIEKNYPGKGPGYNPWKDDELTMCTFVIDGVSRKFRVKE